MGLFIDLINLNSNYKNIYKNNITTKMTGMVDKIIDGLYLGDINAARRLSLLQARGITHVL